MAEKQTTPDYSDVETRRSKASGRRMSAGRKAAYAIGLPIARSLLRSLNASYRIEKIIGRDIADRIIDDRGRACAPCYWHQQHLVCSNLVRQWIRRGFRACWLVSASVDGEVPARIARGWGAEVIRGSAANTGALVLRDTQAMLKRGVSVITTADGPIGPRFEFKAGAVLMARIGGVPLVPIGCAADRAWYMDTWDRFMVPKPFARIAIGIGEPIEVPRDLPMDGIEDIRRRMQEATDGLIAQCREAVGIEGTPDRGD